ncbi:MAG: thioredoxin family protein [Flavobacteriia bacterium]|nr:thioredoxin family protein [Flavobacteriia bacterium]
MKKMIYLVMLAFLGLSFTFSDSSSINKVNNQAQATGIKFENISLDEAKKMAKSSGKIIFIDAYTEWCGPCKRMAATSFMDAEVGKLYNSKFINLKIEVEKTEDGKFIQRTYGIRAYPTLLYIDAEGNLKKSLVGLQTAEQLIIAGKSL